LAKKVKKQKRQKNPVERAIGIVIKIIIALLLAIVVIGGVLIYMKYGKKLIAMESDAKKIVSKSTMETFRQNELLLAPHRNCLAPWNFLYSGHD